MTSDRAAAGRALRPGRVPVAIRPVRPVRAAQAGLALNTRTLFGDFRIRPGDGALRARDRMRPLDRRPAGTGLAPAPSKGA